MLNSFIAIDTETSGLGTTARLVEFGAVLFSNGELSETWGTLLYPDGVNWEDSNVKQAMAVNQISLEELKMQPSYKDKIEEILQLLRAVDVWVAHNADFDIRMLQQEHRVNTGEDFPINPRVCLDTKLLSYKLHPFEKSHKLVDVAARWGVVSDGAHRATSDAATCGRILQEMLRKGVLPEGEDELLTLHKEAGVAWNRKIRKYK